MNKFLILGAAVILTPTMALAGHHMDGEKKHHHKGEMFEKADVNGDGMVSWEEYMAHKEEWLKEKFNKKDANGDGMISKEEMRMAHEKKKGMKEKLNDNAEKSMEKHKERYGHEKD